MARHMLGNCFSIDRKIHPDPHLPQLYLCSAVMQRQTAGCGTQPVALTWVAAPQAKKVFRVRTSLVGWEIFLRNLGTKWWVPSYSPKARKTNFVSWHKYYPTKEVWETQDLCWWVLFSPLQIKVCKVLASISGKKYTLFSGQSVNTCTCSQG